MENIKLYNKEIFTQYLQLKKFAPSSRAKIIRTAQIFSIWCEEQNIPITEVSYNDMTAYVSECKQRGNKPVSVQKTVLNIKHYYNFLNSLSSGEGRGEVDNPCSNIEIHGVKRKTLYETFSPEELETIYKIYANRKLQSNGIGSHIAHTRNKVILGFIIYQGLRTQELAELKPNDLDLREGKIKIEGAKRTEGRELKLEVHQLYHLTDYINETRKLILALSGKQTDKLFTSIGSSGKFANTMQKILEALQKQDPRIKEIKQIRASVITNWLKAHNIRKVQYMAGHRYVGSTEAYQVNNMDDLKEDVNRYHPDL